MRVIWGLPNNVGWKSLADAGGPSSGSRFDAAPNIDHAQPFVKKDLSEWMQWLRESVGFDGWRYAVTAGTLSASNYQQNFASGMHAHPLDSASAMHAHPPDISTKRAVIMWLY